MHGYLVASALARSRARLPASSRAGGSHRGGQAGHRPLFWTGYLKKRWSNCSRYVGSAGGSRSASRSAQCDQTSGQAATPSGTSAPRRRAVVTAASAKPARRRTSSARRTRCSTRLRRHHRRKAAPFCGCGDGPAETWGSTGRPAALCRSTPCAVVSQYETQRDEMVRCSPRCGMLRQNAAVRDLGVAGWRRTTTCC
jgi:hypothetical protein